VTHRIGPVPVLWALGTVAAALVGGCQGPPKAPPAPELRVEAMEVLRQGCNDPAALLRSHAIEALGEVAGLQAVPLLQQGLADRDYRVRYAACVALGSLRHAGSRSLLQERLRDSQEDLSTRLAAVFALHRLGDTRHTSTLAEALLHSRNPTAQRNAAFLLGRLGEPGSIKLLERQMRSEDPALKLQVLEAMALLGSRRAAQELIQYTNSKAADSKLFALMALAGLNDERCYEAFRYRLNDTSEYLEARLQAARGLARIGLADGYELAIDSLSFDEPDPGDRYQRSRVRGLACMVLGDLGSPRALDPLYGAMRGDDAVVRIAAARAILKILNRQAGLGGPRRRG